MLAQPFFHFFVNFTLLPIIDRLGLPQVIFIHEENATAIDPKMFTQLSAQVPTWQVSMGDKTMKLNQSSALFVWTKDPWVSLEVERQRVHQLRKISINTFRSKILILQKDGDGHCETTLRLAWDDHRMLDVTILDPQKIHYYNPFLNTTFHISYNTTTNFFPDKLLNLHQHPLKVGIVNYPPYSYVTYNLQENRYEYQYVFGEILQSLSTTANFNIEPEVVTMAGYGMMNGTTGIATGLINKTFEAKIDLVAFAAFMFFSPFNSKADRTTYILIDQGCPVVPLIPLNKPHLLLADSLQTSIITIGMLVAVVYVFSLLLRLERRLWGLFNIIFLILGITVSYFPKLLRDRFLYGCVMIVSLFYSSNIFAQLTNINLDTGGFEPFESYEDLDKSGLIPVIHPNIMNITFKSNHDPFLINLGKKVVERLDIGVCCPTWVTSHKNVSCVFENLFARVQVKLHKDTQGKEVIKIGQPCFFSITRSFMLPRASPFTERFNRIIRWVEQSGLHERWQVQASVDYKRMMNVTLEDDSQGILGDKGKLTDMLKDDTHRSARYFVVLGSGVSFCVFLGEIAVYRVRKWMVRRKVFA